MTAEPNPIAARLGFFALAINLLAVVPLTRLETAYRPELMDRWAYALGEHELATAWAAWLLSAGALALVPWLVGLAPRLGTAGWAGAGIATMGLAARAMGSLLPFVASRFVPHGNEAIVATLLGATLALEGLFHLALGVGITLLSLAMAARREFPLWMSGTGMVAAVLTMPVVATAWSPIAATVAPLAMLAWCSWVGLTSLHLQWPFAGGTRVLPRERERVPLAPPQL